MKKFLLTLAVVAAMMASMVSAKKPKAHELSAHYTFARYVRDFGKRYTPAEYRMREGLFRAELTKVLAHNGVKEHMWKQGVNHYSDWTAAEKSKLYKGAKPKDGSVPPLKHKPGKHKKVDAASALPLPYAVDWRQAVPPVLTAVKDQGQCGSCWAHATTEGLESAVQRASNERFVASQQQITSCTTVQAGYNGCDGNWPKLAWSYIVDTGAQGGSGVNQEWVISYASYNGNSPNCSSLPISWFPVPGFSVTSYNEVPKNDAVSFADALSKVGPLSITVDASAWSPYESGIFTGCTYDINFGLDHAVQAVGYGTDLALGADYWIVRNSWNAGWGENGYIRLLKEAAGTTNCGWVVNATMNTQGQNTTVCGMCGLYVEPLYGVAPSISDE